MGKVWVLLIVVAVSLSGCRGIYVPSLQGPGSADYQRAWAQRYDPYPENQVGPEILGGRPREFEESRSEPQRARNFFVTPYERSRFSPR